MCFTKCSQHHLSITLIVKSFPVKSHALDDSSTVNWIMKDKNPYNKRSAFKTLFRHYTFYITSIVRDFYFKTLPDVNKLKKKGFTLSIESLFILIVALFVQNINIHRISIHLGFVIFNTLTTTFTN